MSELDNIFNTLYEACPHIKDKVEEDAKWRQERNSLYLKEGYGEDESNFMAWTDYWEKAKMRDDVDFSVNRLN